MSTIKKPTPPKADDSWLSPKKDISHLVADTTTQEPQKGTMEETHEWWLSKFVKGLPTIVTPSITGEPELHPDFIEALHHQLQKARTDWLREEIVRLEGMKTSFVPADSVWFGKDDYSEGEYKLVPSKDPSKAMYCLTCERFLPEEGCNCGTVELQTIIDRYNEELNQPTSPIYDFFTAPEEVQRPVYERALQKAQEEQEKLTNNQTL